MPDSTLEGLDASLGEPIRRIGALIGRLALVAVVVAGATSLLGVRTATATGSGSGYTLELSYPRVARAGLDVTWQLSVHHRGGFAKALTLSLSADQFDIYEHQAFYPEPTSQTRTADQLLLTFESPPGDTFVLSFDAYVQPSSQVGKTATVAVLRRGEPVAAVRYSTVLAP